MRSIEEGIVCNLCGAQWSTHGTACKPKTVVAEPGFAPVPVNSINWVEELAQSWEREAESIRNLGEYPRTQKYARLFAGCITEMVAELRARAESSSTGGDMPRIPAQPRKESSP